MDNRKRQQIQALHYRTGEPILIDIQRGVLAAITSVQLDEEAKRALPIVAPGLVDLQINGFAGIDFNDIPFTEASISKVIELLWREGVTSFCPTIITNSAEAIEQAVATIDRVCQGDPLAAQCIVGIHLEGPFISPEDGAKGAHDKAYIRPPDWELFCRWQAASGQRIRILTLSPEWPCSAEFISRCTASGVMVSIGHTAATTEQIQLAVESGARMSTHLGNGTHLTLPRHPNYMWEQLAQDQLASCLIADGFHLPDQVLKVVMKVKGPKAILVSDAVAICGLPAGTYTTHVGGEVVLTPEGRLHLAQNEQLLAGSAQLQRWGIEHLTSRGLATLADAWEMASTRPAACMDFPIKEGVEAHAPADLVLFRREAHRIIVEMTYKAGECVYQRD
ncbi:N-acetylglucosamine-6-phosphate deacetylase [Paenibacillus pectinilyticus]|uniref:N-acetylglucosamine-6-phosphate deacetylase n=2 Tax=Paenibacillus pectinilyticus TaxID=512399 RepID=A0A1C1A5C6_9BACL|nr:N-acetylglucosamine-6-phosphate deacetylase [Paenibacillus pectinilyticus]